MLPLTARQTQVLLFIQEFMEEQGFPPTRADIAAGLGFRSINAAEDHLKVLARKEAIEILPGTSRGIRLLGDAAETGL
ncbi:MAG: repressor LexA, partial [Alphaproteobacteria bacterium]|nr:repressor LexA [Alphaproteobacteria bacterium]